MREKIITDKFSLLQTILIGFFIMLVVRGKVERKKLCHSGAFLNNTKGIREVGARHKNTSMKQISDFTLIGENKSVF